MNLEDKTNLEDELNRALEDSGLEGWMVVWRPDPSQEVRGRILHDDRTILIFDVKPVEVFETFRHEVIEIVMEPVLSKYRTIINKLIESHEKNIYADKERAYERLAPLMFDKLFDKIQKKLEEHG